ncbi:MAG: DUF2505 family protein [Polyangiaceae bacterium]|nr:DUF2505 family protein [Polyangiaceae bacterium]
MAEVTIRTAIGCTGKTYFEKCLFSADYCTRLYNEVLKFPGVKVLALKTEGDVWTRQLAIDPPLSGLPGPVQKLIGDKFSYIEDGKYDTKSGRYTFKVTPSTAGDKTKTAGESWCEDAADGQSSTLVTKLTVEVKIFMVGGMVEDKIIKDFRASLDQAAPFITTFTKA